MITQAAVVVAAARSDDYALLKPWDTPENEKQGIHKEGRGWTKETMNRRLALSDTLSISPPIMLCVTDLAEPPAGRPPALQQIT